MAKSNPNNKTIYAEVDSAIWEEINLLAQKNRRTYKAQLLIIIEAGLKALAEAEK